MHLQPRKSILSLAPKALWPEGQGRWFCPSTLLWWDPIWSASSSTGVLSIGRTWTLPVGGPEEGRWLDGMEHLSLRKGWGTWGCSAWTREGSRKTFLRTFQYLKETYKKDGGNLLTRPVGLGQRVMVLNCRRDD